MPYLSAVFVRETPNTFSRTGGLYFGQKSFQKPNVKKAWATLPRRGIFISADGLLGRNRQKQIEPSDGTQRKKAEVVPFRTASALTYFQSLKMSSNATSIADFRLFSINLKISASNTDCFFFFLSLSFFLSLTSTSPHL